MDGQLYIPSVGIELAAGRFFRNESDFDRSNSIVLNETAVRKLGSTLESVIGLRMQNVFTDSTFREVIGVVKDYNFTSLKNEIEPLAIAPSDYNYRVAIKIEADKVATAMKGIEQEYKRIVNLYPFEFEFVDANIGALYAEEKNQKNIFILFSLASVIIGCLGILGLATFTANQRSREISIRKVLGASTYNISYMLSNQFVILVLVANVIAWPIAWYFMKAWLSNFAYRIDLSLISFLAAGSVAVLIAVLTVSYQSIKAALVNPADTLRNE